MYLMFWFTDSNSTTDNSTSFCSKEFEDFMVENNINHITNPVANGVAENAVGTVERAFKNAFEKYSFS